MSELADESVDHQYAAVIALVAGIVGSVVLFPRLSARS